MSGAAADVAGGDNKKVALLIAMLALLLSLAEIGSKQAENDAVAKNIEASNLWAFFQAKTIRGTVVRTAAESMEVDLAGVSEPAGKERMQKRIDDWKKTIARYDSEPETNEGRKELVARAKAAETERDTAKARNEKFEIASGLLQIAIVIASASIITGVSLLAVVGGVMGLASLLLMAVGMWAPFSFLLH